MQFIDTHAHLFLNPLGENLDLVLEDANSAGVTKIICPGVDHETSLRSLEIAKNYPNQVFAAIGIHPGHREDISLNFVADFANDESVVAIGEIGIDLFHFDKSTLSKQRNLFESQLGIAKNHELPVIVHGRQAYGEVLQVPMTKDVKGVIHSFEADYQTAKKFLDIGWMISFTGLITYKNYDWLREVVGKIPLDSIMIETDAPYLLPESLKGSEKRNSPKNVVEIAMILSQIKQVSIDKIAATTTKNAEEFFKI